MRAEANTRHALQELGTTNWRYMQLQCENKCVLGHNEQLQEQIQHLRVGLVLVTGQNWIVVEMCSKQVSVRCS